MARQPYLGEGLMAPGVIRLFGRKFEGLELGKEGFDPAWNDPFVLQEAIQGLEQRLADLEEATNHQPKPDDENVAEEIDWDHESAIEQDRKARLVRTYGFSYLGHYYKIANPPVLRVRGQGFPVKPGFLPENHMDILGVEFKHADFVSGLRMWPIDQLEVIVRIDITIGWVRELLLDPEMSKETNVTDNGPGGRADVVGRDSGLVGRDSGLVGRDSGLVGRDSGFVGRSRVR